MSEKKLFNVIERLVSGKKVLILGFGREGQSTYELLVRLGIHKSLWIADKTQFADIEGVDGYCYGAAYQDRMNEFDVVFKSPGVVLARQPHEYHCSIVSQMEVFYEAYKNQIVGITGTKGKSTTSTLIYHILHHAGRKAVIAGNIGIPVFQIVSELTKDTIIVCEMSSHQLEYMDVSPHYGVCLNIYEEHLDHYGTMEKYAAAKERIYRFMEPCDLLVCNAANLPKEGTFRGRILSVSNDEGKADIMVRQGCVYDGERAYTIPMDRICLPGRHSQFNIAVAYGICGRLGITDEAFEQGLVTYEGLPHRLEYFGTYGGVKYYDDSISTICESVIEALESIHDVSTVILGGMDRGIHYGDLIEALSKDKVENIILMEATGKRIYHEITKQYPTFQKKERLHLVEHLEDAVELAAKITATGRSCILSPAAASYGIFKNFEERGDRFKELVRSIK